MGSHVVHVVPPAIAIPSVAIIPAGTTIPGVVTIPPATTTGPVVVPGPPATTTGLPLTAAPAFGVGATGGIGAGTTGGVTTAPGVMTAVLVIVVGFEAPDIRARKRAKSPLRAGVAGITSEYTTGAGVTVVTGGGALVIGAGSSAEAGTAKKAESAAANRNFFMLLPPETPRPRTIPFGPAGQVETVY
jgi:hypothetical protein